jgi:hypothetical protein
MYPPEETRIDTSTLTLCGGTAGEKGSQSTSDAAT